MKYETKLVHIENLLNTEVDNSLINDAINSISNKFHCKLEDLILKALNKKGYTFQNKQQLYEFAKRCELRSYQDSQIKELWYESELICIWNEKTEFNYDFENMKCSIDFKITIG